MLTIGYVGNGKSVNRYHLPFVLQRKNIKVKTIYSLDVVNVRWKKIEGVNYTSNLDELMKDDEIQMIVVCTMQKFHYEYAKMALENGKNVLVEKPFMMTYEQAKEIFDLAKEKGAKNSLIVYKDIAFVTSIENRTVITAVEKERAKENVFTNVDSVVFL